LPRRILIVSLLIALGACGMLHRHHRLAKVEPQVVPPPAPPPRLAQGLWAILDPGCPKPNASNIRLWPSCASPFWINHDKATVIRTEAAKGALGHADASFAADLSIAAGEPLIAQVGTQKDGYLFLALTDLSEDDQGQLIGATGAAVACPKPNGGALALKPSLNGCDGESLEVVRQAAAQTLQDRAALTEVAWIAPGAP
jgi:hypothetical protein